jgi:hypothetical protein
MTKLPDWTVPPYTYLSQFRSSEFLLFKPHSDLQEGETFTNTYGALFAVLRALTIFYYYFCYLCFYV